MVAFQSLWEDLRKEGKQTARFPYEKVISFVFRFYPKEKEKKDVKILEVGCGAGNNLWALAMEGFEVYGIDGSETAIKMAKETFDKFGIKGEFFLQDFTNNFPFKNETFDLVFDRGSITCIDTEEAKRTLSEIYRVLKRNGFFLFNPYSKKHFSYSSSKIKKNDNFVLTEKGTIKNTGFVCFYNFEDVCKLIEEKNWEYIEFKELVIEDKINPENLHGEWEVIVKKK